MKRRSIIFITIMLLAVRSMFGQIIYTDEDIAGLNPRLAGTQQDFNVMVPMQNTNLDQFKDGISPLGDGLLLLIGLGGGYLLRKKYKNRK